MAKARTPTLQDLKDEVARIQVGAWGRLGVRIDELVPRFAARRQAFADLAASRQDYRDFTWGLDEAVIAEHQLALGVDDLWKLSPPTDYQDPAVYAWLELTWRYIGIHLPFKSDVLDQIVLATAPTGDFNAMAVPLGRNGAIVLEEAVITLGRRLCGLVGTVLFRSQDGVLLVRTKREIADLLDYDQEAPIEIAQLFVDYMTAGRVDLPLVPSVAPQRSIEERFSDTIFESYIAFVLWHEAFHLEVAAGNLGAMPADGVARDADAMVVAMRALATSMDIDLDEAAIRTTFAHQREEASADAYAMIRNAVYGSRTKCLPGTVSGGMTFFYALETVHRILLQITDQTLYALEGTSSLPQLRAAAILGHRDHPHPRVRRAEVVDLIKRLDIGVGEMVGFEEDRLDILFQFVWRYLEATINVAGDDFTRRVLGWLAPDAAAVDLMSKSLAQFR